MSHCFSRSMQTNQKFFLTEQMHKQSLLGHISKPSPTFVQNTPIASTHLLLHLSVVYWKFFVVMLHSSMYVL